MKPRKEREQARQGVVEARRDMREARDTGAVTQALENYLRQMSDRLGEARARMLPDMLPLPKEFSDIYKQPPGIMFEEEEHERGPGGKFTTMSQHKEPEILAAPKRPKVPQPGILGAPKPPKAPEILGAPKREARMADPARLMAGGTTAQQYMEQLGLMQATQAAAQAQQAVAQASQAAAAASSAVATQQAQALSQHALQIAQMAYETAMRSQMGAQPPGSAGPGVGEKTEAKKEPAKPKEKKTGRAGTFDEKKIQAALVAEAKRRQEKESDPEVTFGRRAAQLREAGFKGELSPDLVADPKRFESEMKKLGKKTAGGHDFPLSSKDKFIVYTAALQERAKSDLVKRITGSSRDEPNATHRVMPQVGGVEPGAPHKPPRPPKPPQQKQMRVDPRAVEGPRVRTVKLPRIATYLHFPK